MIKLILNKASWDNVFFFDDTGNNVLFNSNVIQIERGKNQIYSNGSYTITVSYLAKDKIKVTLE